MATLCCTVARDQRGSRWCGNTRGIPRDRVRVVYHRSECDKKKNRRREEIAMASRDLLFSLSLR
jgi:hypothetical protein